MRQIYFCKNIKHMWLSLNLKKKKICPLLLNEYIRQILLLLFIAENQFKSTKMLKYFVNQTFFFFQNHSNCYFVDDTSVKSCIKSQSMRE